MDIKAGKIRDSYLALLRGVPESQREELFRIAKGLYPEIAEVLVEQFREVEPSNADTKAKIVGATFMLLALVNASLNEPVIEISQKELGILGSSSFHNFPTFGKLKPLGD